MIDFFYIAFITLLGAMIPGPNFALVTKYIFTGSKKAAFYAALGVSVAILAHFTASALGTTILLIRFPFILSIIMLGGSIYVGWLGVSLLLQKKDVETKKVPAQNKAFLKGFLGNLLNPKTTLFIFGVFTQLIAPGTSWLKLALYSIVMASVSLGWYSCLIALMTHSYFKHHFNSWQNILMKIMGIVLLGISLTIFVNAITRIL